MNKLMVLLYKETLDFNQETPALLDDKMIVELFGL